MAKSISDIKKVSDELSSLAKRGQFDERRLVSLVTDVVNHLHAASLAPAAPAPAVVTPAPAEAPKSGRKKAVTNTQTPAVPEVTVGSAVPTPTPVEKPKAGGSTSTPINVKVGRGVTVGTKTTVKTGVTVGSAPVNPAGQVTVGGRIRKP